MRSSAPGCAAIAGAGFLVMMRDECADARRNPTRTEPESILSGRTLAEVAAEAGDPADAGDG